MRLRTGSSDRLRHAPSNIGSISVGGLTALGKLGVRPDGYRSPGWELTPETLELLGELGFCYDASLMADDRPYWVSSGGQPLLELPGHWSLCDWPYFGWTSSHL